MHQAGLWSKPLAKPDDRSDCSANRRVRNDMRGRAIDKELYMTLHATFHIVTRSIR
jgi:hypothetical protein